MSSDVVGQLEETWSSIDTLLAGLGPEQWTLPTSCPGWTVRDQVAHLVGTESALAGRPAPEPAADERPHVRNDVGRSNEAWIDQFREATPREMLAAYREVTAARLERLRGMTDADFAAESWTPIGPGTYGRFMQIRVFDNWVHEQDIRDAIGQPGHDTGPAAERSFDEMAGAMGYTVGKRAQAPDGSSVTIDLTGPVRRGIHVAVAGRAKVVDHLDAPATATLVMSSGTFVRLACGRVDPAGEIAAGRVVVEGDQALGDRVARHLAFTI